jgi:N-acetylglutamate synthase-like GNAT family acetyltransferase
MKERIKAVVENSGLSTEDIDSHDTGWVVQNQANEIVGYSGIERRGSNVYLQSLAVEKKYRKCGIGRRLVEEAYKHIDLGDTLIALTLFWNNDFYRECGFEKLDAKKIKTLDDVAGRVKHKYCVAWGKIK